MAKSVNVLAVKQVKHETEYAMFPTGFTLQSFKYGVCLVCIHYTICCMFSLYTLYNMLYV